MKYRVQLRFAKEIEFYTSILTFADRRLADAYRNALSSKWKEVQETRVIELDARA